jgi:hypothetical protein
MEGCGYVTPHVVSPPGGEGAEMTTPTESTINPSTRKGITLRDYFAGQALPVCLDVKSGPDSRPRDAATLAAKMAYHIADAMLEARKQGPT